MKKRANIPFAQRHPRWNMAIGLLMLFTLMAIAIYGAILIIAAVGNGLSLFSNWLSSIATNLDAVVIVALITGAVSIIGVVVSSIVSKSIDYRQKRREYLYQKREEPYSAFIAVVYKMQQNSKGTLNYPEAEMLEDMYKFSQKLTLWGSNGVIKKWLKFRESSNKNISGTDSLFTMENIMFEMRKDMGLRKMKKGNLLSFFVNDIKNYTTKK